MTLTENRNFPVQNIYDARAVGYEGSRHPKSAEQFLATLEEGHLVPSDQVIDLACGTGLVTFLAAQQVTPNGDVWGLDISSGMLKVARKKQKQLTNARRDALTLLQREVGDLTKVDAFSDLKNTLHLKVVFIEQPGGGKSFDGDPEEASKAYDDLIRHENTLDGWLGEHESDSRKKIRDGSIERWAACAKASQKIENVAGMHVAVAKRL